MGAGVYGATVSAGAHGEEGRKWATPPPDTSRSSPPAASSVLSISENAVESQASSGRPEALLKPITATETRGLTDGGCDPRTRLLSSAEVSRWYEATPAATSKARAKPKSTPSCQCALS